MVRGSATVVLGNTSLSLATFNALNPLALGSGTITLNAGGTLWVQPENNGTWTGATYNYANNFVFNGGTLIGQDGTQRFGTTSGTSGPFNTITINGPNTSTVEATWNGKDVFLDGVISGSGSLLLTHNAATAGSNPAIHFTNSASTYSGIVSISGATSTSVQVTLSIDNATALQFATVNTLAGTAPGLVLINATGGVKLGALTGTAGTVRPTTTAGTYTLTLTGSALNATNTYGGVLVNNTGVLALTMTDPNNASAVQILSGNNTYTGATAVTSGILTLSGINSGTSGFTVSSGATLNLSGSYTVGAGTTSVSGSMLISGTSTATGATTINSGGTLQIGNGGATGSIASGTVITFATGASAENLTFNNTSNPVLSNSITVSGTNANISVLGSTAIGLSGVIGPGSSAGNLTVSGAADLLGDGEHLQRRRSKYRPARFTCSRAASERPRP